MRITCTKTLYFMYKVFKLRLIIVIFLLETANGTNGNWLYVYYILFFSSLKLICLKYAALS